MKKAIAAILAMCAAWASWGMPVRAAISGRIEGDGREAPQNLWVWPTEEVMPPKTLTPSDVWEPEIGVWYTAIAPNGYVRRMSYGSWMANSVTTINHYGYAMGTFLALEPGRYSLDCNTDGDTWFQVGYYKAVENGYLWHSYVKLSRQRAGGWYSRVFTVPDGCSLVLIGPTPTGQGYGTDEEVDLTTTDIEIYRLD